MNIEMSLDDMCDFTDRNTELKVPGAKLAQLIMSCVNDAPGAMQHRGPGRGVETKGKINLLKKKKKKSRKVQNSNMFWELDLVWSY